MKTLMLIGLAAAFAAGSVSAHARGPVAKKVPAVQRPAGNPGLRVHRPSGINRLNPQPLPP
jgi:hypothetical protein